MKIVTYDINDNLLKKGIEELLKFRVNEIINHGGPFTLSSALDNYQSTRQLALRFGVDIAQKDKIIDEYLIENNLR